MAILYALCCNRDDSDDAGGDDGSEDDDDDDYGEPCRVHKNDALHRLHPEPRDEGLRRCRRMVRLSLTACFLAWPPHVHGIRLAPTVFRVPSELDCGSLFLSFFPSRSGCGDRPTADRSIGGSVVGQIFMCIYQPYPQQQRQHQTPQSTAGPTDGPQGRQTKQK